MVEKFTALTDLQRQEHEAKHGRFNDKPLGWREVDEAYIATKSLFRMYAPLMREYRQIINKNDCDCIASGNEAKPKQHGADAHAKNCAVYRNDPALHVTLYFFHDGTGVGMSFDYWAKKIRWFVFGCEHRYAEVSRPAGNRSGLHTSRCTICGYVNSYDTSD